MVGFFIAVLSGILMSVQGVFNTQVTKQSSLWTTSCFCTAYSTLGLCSGMAFYGSEQSAEGTCGKAFLPAARRRDRCVYHLYGRCQHGKAGTCKGGHVLLVIAQLISAYLIELLGMFGVRKEPFSVRKLVGMAVAVIGVIVFKM